MRLTASLQRDFREQVSIPDSDFDQIVNESGRNAISFALRAIKQGVLDRHTAGRIIGNAMGCSYINLDHYQVEEGGTTYLNLIDALTLQAISIKSSEDNIIIATDHPSDLDKKKLPEYI